LPRKPYLPSRLWIVQRHLDDTSSLHISELPDRRRQSRRGIQSRKPGFVSSVAIIGLFIEHGNILRGLVNRYGLARVVFSILHILVDVSAAIPTASAVSWPDPTSSASNPARFRLSLHPQPVSRDRLAAAPRS